MPGQKQPNPPGSGARILIVSGDLPLRERFYNLLTRKGYSVRTVTSGNMGFEGLKDERVDLILANSSANDGPGWGFPDRVRRFDEKVPIVLIGHPGEQPPDSRTLRDIQAHLPSDVSDTVLLQVIKRWLTATELAEPVPLIDYPGTILAIDDEPGVLRTLEEFLRPRGCTVVTALSGEEGLRELERCDPSLVLLDLKMPGMDGLITLKKIKAARPNLPVIIGTAVEDPGLLEETLAFGAYEFVTKPYDLSSFQTLLSHIKRSFLPE